MENVFEIGDLVSHKKRNYFGFIVEIIEPNEEMTTLIYKVSWEHGEWMYEMEDQLRLEVKAKNT